MDALLLLNSGVSGPKFTKFLHIHSIARSSQMNLLKSELRYSTPFRNAKATNEGKSADFAHFNPKIGCHGNVSWAIGKRQYTAHERYVKGLRFFVMWPFWVNISIVRTQRSDIMCVYTVYTGWLRRMGRRSDRQRKRSPLVPLRK